VLTSPVCLARGAIAARALAGIVRGGGEIAKTYKAGSPLERKAEDHPYWSA